MRQLSTLAVSAPGWTPGVKKLDMFAPGTEGRRTWESTGIYSPDGEYLPLLGPIITEGRPEEWLNKVEEAMFATTKKHLFKVLEDSKGVSPCTAYIWHGTCADEYAPVPYTQHLWS
jgi:hypothetical protein